ncbi:PREDICTED: MuDR family transposase [Prunus dulcis]|uniref:PREDICTED: MuDR family transposase n=1 Tax=Prunus dulcis TaxID=3755 RepID=A0A5E4E770_PRUDU|nr:PREDICTED: MuDR family transposase [Prunus dulcis]
MITHMLFYDHFDTFLVMARTKLILICQSGGEFVIKDDGSMSYTGGEAHAVDINLETVFDDLKFKLAEMLNLEYKSISMKYFLPGNTRTLITLSNDKDLKRMYEFHGKSVTADVFVMGKAGFDSEALSTQRRACGIKLAESVTPVAASTTSAAALHSSPLTVPTDVKSAVGSAAANAIPVVPAPLPLSKQTCSVMSVEERTQSPSGVDAPSSIPSDPVTVTADAIVHSSNEFDINATPADTVKKRRRTAAWKIGADGPTIVAGTDHVGEKRKVMPRKKNIVSHNTTAETDDVGRKQDTLPCKDSSTSSDPIQDTLGQSNDVPPEKLVTLWKDGITGVGQEFKSVKEFRDALQKYGIAHRFMYRLKKNDTNRASGRCIAEGCSWRIHASWDSSVQRFRIKNMNKIHTCGREFWKSYHPTKSWLVSIIKDRLLDSPHLKPKELANGILQDFGIAVNYTQVWRGIEDARELLLGSYREAYNQLPWFCEKMAEANPGSNIMLFTVMIGDFNNGCRPIIFLDATSLKSKYHETFFAATALDGDDGVFPVAFAIVDVENDDNWRWFLEQLRSVVSTSQSLTFVSDREKGLKKSVIEVFENAHHGYSLHRLLESFKKNLKGPFHGDGKGLLPINFVAAAHAVRLDGFKTSTDQIRRVSSQAYDWVLQIEPECWTNALFKGEHYNHVTSDVAETYIKWIEEVRELPIAQKIEVLSCKLMELINTRRTDSSTWPTKLTPSKEEKLRQETLQAYGLKVLFSSDTLFEVHKDSINVVDIDKWDCSCLKWKATGLPCCHAIAVFNCTGRNVYDYCSRYFKANNFQLTYSESINPSAPFQPLDSDTIDLETLHVLPPFISKPQNQEKKKQTRTKGVITRTVTCARCKEVGHNKATCKAPTTPTP